MKRFSFSLVLLLVFSLVSSSQAITLLDATKPSNSTTLNLLPSIEQETRTKVNELIEAYDDLVLSTTGTVIFEPGDGVTDYTTQINNYFADGRSVQLAQGTYIVTSLVIPTGVSLRGLGKGITILKEKAGTNADIITTAGYATSTAAYDWSIRDLTIDGNYINGNWNDLNPGTNNTAGYGLKIYGYGFVLDIELYNIAGVGGLIRGPTSFPANQNNQSRISIDGRVFGKEGLIIKGPGDIVYDHVFIGLCGILPLPGSATTLSTSLEYFGEKVDGVVVDGTNIEAGNWHVYACWNGIGIRTRGNVRFEGNHIITESNNGGIYLSTGTYGTISQLSIRNNGLYYPSWTGAAPVYDVDADGYDSNWDACTIESDSFNIPSYFNYRSVLTSLHLDGWKSLVLTANARGNRIGFTHKNSTDPGTGVLNAGDAVHILGEGNLLTASLDSVNGTGIMVASRGNNISFLDNYGINGYAIVRDGGATSGLTTNTIIGSVRASSNTRGAFNSLQGTPNGENINIVFELATGSTAFTGTVADPNRTQNWNISGRIGAVATRYVGSDTYTKNVFPETDNTHYIGKNDDDSPAAWKGMVLKDVANGKYYRIQLSGGAVQIVDLTD